MPPLTITIEGRTITVPEYLYSLAYLARVFEVGSTDIKDAYLSVNLDDAYTFLNSNIGDGQYGDVAIYDISFAGTRPPSMIKTLPSRRVPLPPG
jgi:hypothetical protein